ncbi:hypothetical protein HOLleu_02244 [Holothuria leucospilota]|uniref:Uncharacterized protein n=1 Tax=Holothuria leucospilota TaxID=206669 RepID=A0A9Q1CRD1_HOLLE|nr:hypothetical protein HOLleu_02244 [Holothuria leucospilota]
MFNPGMTMHPQVTNVVRSANYHLTITFISRAGKMLSTKANKLAVHTLFTSPLDYCNGLPIGISRTLITSPKNVQHTSACNIVTRAKYESITPVLIDLHWLPIQQCIQFKALLLVYKVLHKQSPSYISRIYCSFNLLADS